MNSRSVIASAFLAVSLTCMVQTAPAQASADTSSVASTTDYDGVTVKHNPDGSLEVYDAEDSAAQRVQRPQLTANAQPPVAVSDAQVPLEATAGSLFAVKPVVAPRKETAPNGKNPVRSWSHGISAL